MPVLLFDSFPLLDLPAPHSPLGLLGAFPLTPATLAILLQLEQTYQHVHTHNDLLQELVVKDVLTTYAMIEAPAIRTYLLGHPPDPAGYSLHLAPPHGWAEACAFTTARTWHFNATHCWWRLQVDPNDPPFESIQIPLSRFHELDITLAAHADPAH